MSTAVITTLGPVPDFAVGLVRDLRIIWALEELQRPYELRAIGWDVMKAPAFAAQQPFGQVPCYEENGICMFETGAILSHIALAGGAALLPEDPQARATALSWMWAALNSLEPRLQPILEVEIFWPDRAGSKEIAPALRDAARDRLDQLAMALGDGDYLDGAFSIADLMMATVLRIVRHTDLVTGHKVLGPYLARCETRPAMLRAEQAQKDFYAARANA